MNKQTVKDLNLNNKKVLLRVDFNVPMKDGVIADDNRIVEALQTINYILLQGASLIIVSHLGRPDGKVVSKYSLAPVAKKLSELINKKVKFSKDIVGAKTTEMVAKLKPGEVLMLENIRYLPEEEDNDDGLAKKLASLADVFVFDAFGTSHRKHASTYGVAKHLPSAIGFLVQREIEMISKNIEQPKRPFTAILGGAKVSDKLNIINSLLSKADAVIIGGAMAYTFLKAKDINVGNSLVEEDMVPVAKQILQDADSKGVAIFLPVDHIVAKEFNDTKAAKYAKFIVPDGYMGLDIGKKSVKMFKKLIKHSNLIVWNGPMGVFENPTFAKGTYRVAKAVAHSQAISIVGGGESASAVINFGFKNKITHISTGGGASLKLIEGKPLPALEVINDIKS